jgi:hypothetical protein
VGLLRAQPALLIDKKTTIARGFHDTENFRLKMYATVYYFDFTRVLMQRAQSTLRTMRPFSITLTA